MQVTTSELCQAPTRYLSRLCSTVFCLKGLRGQVGWLAPQPEVDYGLFYRQVSLVPRPEGIVVQYVGDNEMFGYGSTDETPDRSETERAIAAVAPLFA